MTTMQFLVMDLADNDSPKADIDAEAEGMASAFSFIRQSAKFTWTR